MYVHVSAQLPICMSVHLPVSVNAKLVSYSLASRKAQLASRSKFYANIRAFHQVTRVQYKQVVAMCVVYQPQKFAHVPSVQRNVAVLCHWIATSRCQQALVEQAYTIAVSTYVINCISIDCTRFSARASHCYTVYAAFRPVFRTAICIATTIRHQLRQVTSSKSACDTSFKSP